MILRFYLLLLLTQGFGLNAQSALRFKNLSEGTTSCPRQDGSTGAHTGPAARPMLDAAAEQVFPKESRPDVSTFGVLDQEGKLTKISDLKGRLVIVGVWSTQCRVSTQELYELGQLQKQAADHNYPVTVLPVHIETWPEVAAFLRSNSKDFAGIKISKAALAPNGLSQLGTEIQALPALYLIDREGRLVASWEGFILNRLVGRLNPLLNEK